MIYCNDPLSKTNCNKKFDLFLCAIYLRKLFHFSQNTVLKKIMTTIVCVTMLGFHVVIILLTNTVKLLNIHITINDYKCVFVFVFFFKFSLKIFC